MEEEALGLPLNDRDIGWVQDGKPGQAEGRQRGQEWPRTRDYSTKPHKAHQPGPEQGVMLGQVCGGRDPCVVRQRRGGWRVSSRPSPGPPQKAPNPALTSPTPKAPPPGAQAAQAPVQKGAPSPLDLQPAQSLQAASPGSPRPTGLSYLLPAPAPPLGPYEHRPVHLRDGGQEMDPRYPGVHPRSPPHPTPEAALRP